MQGQDIPPKYFNSKKPAEQLDSCESLAHRAMSNRDPKQARQYMEEGFMGTLCSYPHSPLDCGPAWPMCLVNQLSYNSEWEQWTTSVILTYQPWCPGFNELKILVSALP